jgi:uncharacterized protein YndB with AHSA1/START domain
MSLLDLVRPKWNNSDPGVRRAAVAGVTDQATLARVAAECGYPDTASEALRRLTVQEGLGTVAARGKDPEVRQKALARLTDEQQLARVAVEAADSEVGSGALARVTSPAALAEIAMQTRDVLRAVLAFGRVRSDPGVVARIALGAREAKVRLVAVLSPALDSQDTLDRVVRQDGEGEVRVAAVRKLRDQGRLLEIASTHTPSIGFGNLLERLAAVEALSDPAILADIAHLRRKFEGDPSGVLAAVATLNPHLPEEDVLKVALAGDWLVGTSAIKGRGQAAVSRLKNTAKLLQVAQSARSPLVRAGAARRIEEEAVLTELARAAGHDEVRTAAAETLAALKTLQKIEVEGVVDDPPAVVWACLTDVSSWASWWGGHRLEKVSPGWENGAQLVWSPGAPSTIHECEPERLLDFGAVNMGMEIHRSFQLTGVGASTSVLYRMSVKGGTVPPEVKAQETSEMAKALADLAATVAAHREQYRAAAEAALVAH